MQDNELRIIGVDIRAHDVRHCRYGGSHGIFTGLANLGVRQPKDAETTATLRALTDGKRTKPLAIYRVNDEFLSTAPDLKDRCHIVFASLESDNFRMEAFQPCVAEVFTGLHEVAAYASAMGITTEIALRLECDGSPRLAFTIYRVRRDVFLRIEQGEPRFIEE